MCDEKGVDPKNVKVAGCVDYSDVRGRTSKKRFCQKSESEL